MKVNNNNYRANGKLLKTNKPNSKINKNKIKLRLLYNT